MSAAFKLIMDNMKELSLNERALIAHCLISSLESKQDEGVDEAWVELSEQRLKELQSGKVKGVSWSEITHGLNAQDG